MKIKVMLACLFALAFAAGIWHDTPKRQPAKPANTSPNANASPTEKANTISYIPMTDGEYTSIQSAAGTDNLFIYQFQTDDESMTQIDCWVEHYVNGAFKETMASMGTSIRPKRENKLYWSLTNVNDKEQMWIVSVRDGGSFSSSKGSIPKEAYISSMSGSIIGSQEMIVPDEPMTLSAIIRKKEQGVMIFKPDPEQLIKTYDEVYLLKCRFKA
ncbi:hypothetical protein [Paenibacillus ehimensis]|uniref:Uncharacterized protein n=1 Tax=Paenibacillus ehimensis TaxID=79264 RepID=A0ABT8VF93_9BACL|nr:hypothetical protein [Paenibacillus ehimensis]MDO3679646.1 hypothetical protein [Paenibacillus ehimensis]MEC0213387.1 hypothetical protein [Paenibacillus ehimensis]